MKKYLKYSGLCAAVLAIVAFILVMVGQSIVYAHDGDIDGIASAAEMIFGGTRGSGVLVVKVNLAATALIGWILLLAGMLIVIAGVVLPLLKVRALEKFAGVLNLVAVGAMVTAGILFLFSKPAWQSANPDLAQFIPDEAGLSANFVIGAILSIVAGAVAILPAAFDFVGSKKK